MIRVPRPIEPKHFEKKVRVPGRLWLKKGGRGRPPSHWRVVTADLMEAFSHRCGYSAMFDLNGEVDHFVARGSDRALLYEWANLRYASHWINSSKQDKEGILDPYEVGEGWFEVLLPSLQLVATERVPRNKRQLVESTLARLPIAHDERVIRQRRAWLIQYEKGRITLEGLREFAPLVAAAVEKRETQARTVEKRPPKKAAKRKPAPR